MNPYDVLNVRKNASNSEIKLSFNRLMEKYDLKNYPGDPYFAKKRMSEIAEAYNILSDTQKRKAYDDAHDIHVNLHQKEKINNDDVFTPYYKRQKTTAHIHNDYEIAKNKYDTLNSLDENYSNPISNDFDNNSSEEKDPNSLGSLIGIIILFIILFQIVSTIVDMLKILY